MHITDGHVHCFRRETLDQLLADLQYTGVDKFALMVTAARDTFDRDGAQLDNAFALKQRFPDRAFVFGGLDYLPDADVSYEQQLRDLMHVGCDGLKLLIGKPDRRKALGIPLESDVFRPMLKLAEDTQFPVLWHVSDPPEFWSEHTVPLWAKQRGWWYGDTHPRPAQIEAEIANVFARHPKLHLILPHFFFHSNRLAEAAALLEKYPSYSLDLAPGVEMFHHFTANRAETRAFFIRFADRIIFGTDFGLPCGWHKDRGWMIRRFLETEDTFPVPDDPAMSPDDRPQLHGIALPKDVLRLIYVENHRCVVGEKPKPLHLSARKGWMSNEARAGSP